MANQTRSNQKCSTPTSEPIAVDSDPVDVYAELQRERVATRMPLYRSRELVICPAELADENLVHSLFDIARKFQSEKGFSAWALRTAAEISTELATGTYHLAKIGAELAGMVSVSFRDVRYWGDSGTGEAAYVHKLAVADKFRGQGVSQRLLEHAEQLAARAGCQFVRLDTHPPVSLYRNYQQWGYRLHSRAVLADTGYQMTRWEKPLTAEAREKHRQGLIDSLEEKRKYDRRPSDATPAKKG